MTKLVYVVTGASGKLGEAFIETLKKEGHAVISLSRRPTGTAHVVDLLDTTAVDGVCQTLDFTGYDEVRLIHTVGKFKFEHGSSITDADGDGIDDEVYATNVLTLKNLLACLMASPVPHITVCVFASVSDKYDVPYWSSYTRAKNIMRGYLQTLAELGRVRALVTNVSTVDTGNENLLRPNADRSYWLSPADVVATVLPRLEGTSAYKEIDVIKEKPNFAPDYYVDHDAILKKWEKEMGV